MNYKGEDYQAKATMDHFVGIYSGRLRPDSDLGLVWKRSCIEELVEHAVSHGTQHQMSLCRHKFLVPPSPTFSLGSYARNDEDQIE